MDNVKRSRNLLTCGFQMQQRLVDFRSERCGDEQRYQNGGVISRRLPAAVQDKGVVLKQLDTLVKK
jgi:hypothetical protein